MSGLKDKLFHVPAAYQEWNKDRQNRRFAELIGRLYDQELSWEELRQSRHHQVDILEIFRILGDKGDPHISTLTSVIKDRKGTRILLSGEIPHHMDIHIRTYPTVDSQEIQDDYRYVRKGYKQGYYLRRNIPTGVENEYVPSLRLSPLERAEIVFSSRTVGDIRNSQERMRLTVTPTGLHAQVGLGMYQQIFTYPSQGNITCDSRIGAHFR